MINPQFQGALYDLDTLLPRTEQQRICVLISPSIWFWPSGDGAL